jgi:alpha-mannosidase
VGRAGEPVPFAEAVRQTYAPLPPGSAWGRPWGTVWLHVTGTAPDPEPGTVAEVLVDLGFTDAQPGFQAEGLVHAPDGRVLHGLEPRRRHVRVEGGRVDLYVEAAANPDLTATGTSPPPPTATPPPRATTPCTASARSTAALRTRRCGSWCRTCGRCAGCTASSPATRPGAPRS